MNIYIGPAAVFSSKQYSKFFFFFSCNFCAARIVGGKNIKKRKEKKTKTCYQTKQNVTAAVQYDRELWQPTQPNNFGTECKKNRGEKREKCTHKTFRNLNRSLMQRAKIVILTKAQSVLYSLRPGLTLHVGENIPLEMVLLNSYKDKL